MSEFEEMMEKIAEAMKQAEKDNKFLTEGQPIEPPIVVKSLKVQQIGLKRVTPQYVAVRPVSDKKTYLGIYLGDVTVSGGSMYNIPKSEIFVSFRMNPMIFIPDLMKVVLGMESWWSEIEKPEDLKQITDADIQNVWYVKALKELNDKAKGESND